MNIPSRYVVLPRNAVLTALPSVWVAEPPRSHCEAEPRNEEKKSRIKL